MYYEYPQQINACMSTNFSQYMFGHNIIVRLVTTRSGNGVNFNLTNQSIWTPTVNQNDCWYELNSGKYFHNNTIMYRKYG